MGTMRESNDPKLLCPSSLFGFSDWPDKGFILIDDIAETVLTRNKKQGFGELYTFDELEKRMHVGIVGANRGL